MQGISPLRYRFGRNDVVLVWLAAGRGTHLPVLPKGRYGHRRLARRGSLPAGRGIHLPRSAEGKYGHWRLARRGSLPAVSHRRQTGWHGYASSRFFRMGFLHSAIASVEMTSMDALSHNVISTGVRVLPERSGEIPHGKGIFSRIRNARLPFRGIATVASRHGQVG